MEIPNEDKYTMDFCFVEDNMSKLTKAQKDKEFKGAVKRNREAKRAIV